MIEVATLRQKEYSIPLLKENLQKAFNLCGLSDLFKGKKVLIKPNCGIVASPEEAHNTHFLFLRALVEVILLQNPLSVVLGESSVVGVDTMEAFRKSHVLRLSKLVDVVDFKKAKFIYQEVHAGKILKTVRIAKTASEADWIVSAAKLKAFFANQMSLSMKNLKGILADDEKKRFHRVGVQSGLIDLFNTLPNTIGVIDGIISRDVDRILKTGFIIVSKNLAAADIVASKLVGVDPRKIPHLSHFYTGIKRNVLMVGDRIQLNQQFFRRALEGSALVERPDVTILNGNPCTGCTFAVHKALESLRIQRAHIYLAVGPKVLHEDLKKRNCLAIGNCLRQRRQSCSSVSGCPPRYNEISEAIRKSQQSRRRDGN